MCPKCAPGGSPYGYGVLAGATGRTPPRSPTALIGPAAVVAGGALARRFSICLRPTLPPTLRQQAAHAGVSHLLDNTEDEATTAAAIDLGHRLGLRVVVEGRRNRPAPRPSRHPRGDPAQGFAISHPLLSDEFSA